MSTPKEVQEGPYTTMKACDYRKEAGFFGVLVIKDGKDVFRRSMNAYDATECAELLNAAFAAGKAVQSDGLPGGIDVGLLLGAIDKWGRASQIEMIQEEAMELALALQQMRRKSKDRDVMMDRVLDEIADVTIVIAQANILFDHRKIAERVRFKMDRLAQRLESLPSPPIQHDSK